MSFHYWRSVVFPDHVIKISRKRLDQGAWNELDSLSSRADFYYSVPEWKEKKKKKKEKQPKHFGSFFISPYIYIYIYPRNGKRVMVKMVGDALPDIPVTV